MEIYSYHFRDSRDFWSLVILQNTTVFAGFALLTEGIMRHYIVHHTAKSPDERYLNDNKLS